MYYSMVLAVASPFIFGVQYFKNKGKKARGNLCCVALFLIALLLL